MVYYIERMVVAPPSGVKIVSSSSLESINVDGFNFLSLESSASKGCVDGRYIKWVRGCVGYSVVLA